MKLEKLKIASASKTRANGVWLGQSLQRQCDWTSQYRVCGTTPNTRHLHDASGLQGKSQLNITTTSSSRSSGLPTQVILIFLLFILTTITIVIVIVIVFVIRTGFLRLCV